MSSAASSKKSKVESSIALLGHVDSGKSTLLGHLMLDLGCFSQSQLEKNYREAAETGKRSFCYAYLLDKTSRERDRGLTLELRSASVETPKTLCTFYDASGLRDFIKQISQSCSHADSAILVIAAGAGEFESGICLEGQTRSHALLAWAMGIRRLIVAVNKMDDRSVNFSEARFDEIKDEVSRILVKNGFARDKVQYIPISAWTGENMFEPFPTAAPWSSSSTSSFKACARLTSGTSSMPWYVSGKEFANLNDTEKNQAKIDKNLRGKTLVEAIDSLDDVVGPVAKLIDQPLRFLVDDSFLISPSSSPPKNTKTANSRDNNNNKTTTMPKERKICVAAGKIVSGHMKVGDVLVFEPGHVIAIAKKIERFHESLEIASAGEAVGVEIERLIEDGDNNNNNNNDKIEVERKAGLNNNDDDDDGENESDKKSILEKNAPEHPQVPLVKLVRRGIVGGHFHSSLRPYPVRAKSSVAAEDGHGSMDTSARKGGFLAKIIVLRHPSSIKTGYEPIVDVGSAHRACSLEILALCDKRTGKIIEENENTTSSSSLTPIPSTATTKKPANILEIKTGMAAIVRLTPVYAWKTLVVEPCEFIPALGRLALRDMRSVVAVGMVMSLWKERKWVFEIRANGKEGSKEKEAFQIWNILTNVALFIRPW